MTHAGYDTPAEYRRRNQRSYATMRANVLELIREAEALQRELPQTSPTTFHAELKRRVGQCVATLYLLANLDPPSAVEPFRRLAALLDEPLQMPSTFVEFLQRYDQREPADGNVIDLAAWRTRQAR